VRNLIYSEKFGRKSFNLDVPDRAEIMQTLLEGSTPELNGEGESVRNIALRYADIVDHFPEEIAAEPLPFFIDWLLENVHLVAIEAYSDEDAYTIFETMNNRGLSLSLPEMLKGYVLATSPTRTTSAPAGSASGCRAGGSTRRSGPRSPSGRSMRWTNSTRPSALWSAIFATLPHDPC